MPKITNHIFVYKSTSSLRGCTFYLITGTIGQYMIDAGATKSDIDERKLREIIEDGIDITRTLGIFLTHIHPDHVRGISFWLKKIGKQVPIYTQPNGVQYIKDHSSILKKINETLGPFQKEVSKLPQKGSVIVTNWLWGKPINYENAQAVQDGQEFDLGGVKIRVIWTPGHSQEHCVYEVIQTDGTDPKRYLFTGDMISFKDMKDGKGLQALASINNPMSLFQPELESLKKFLKKPPDVILTGHYGIHEPKEANQQFLSQAIEEGEYLWNRTLQILKAEGPLRFKQLTKKVINFKKYLSGIDTRTSSMFVILSELLQKGLIQQTSIKPPIFQLKL